MTRDGRVIVYPKNKEVLPGPETTYAGLGPEWANVNNMPFRFWKAKMYEGGICTPAIMHWPKGLKTPKGAVTAEPCHIIDIMATCLELAKAEYPETYSGHQIIPLEGKSMVPILETGKRKGHEIIGFEHFNEKALMSADGWKIVQPGKEKPWELYDLNTDRAEMTDMAAQHPDRLNRMSAQYEVWAERTLVVPAP
jgi:arylsulfatase